MERDKQTEAMSDTPETDEVFRNYEESKIFLSELKERVAKMERQRDEARKVAILYADAYGGAFDFPWEKPNTEKP